MAVAVLDLPRHKLADVLDNLATTIRKLEKENAELKAQIAVMDRKANHGCYNFDCPLCDKQWRIPRCQW